MVQGTSPLSQGGMGGRKGGPCRRRRGVTNGYGRAERRHRDPQRRQVQPWEVMGALSRGAHGQAGSHARGAGGGRFLSSLHAGAPDLGCRSSREAKLCRKEALSAPRSVASQTLKSASPEG